MMVRGPGSSEDGAGSDAQPNMAPALLPSAKRTSKTCISIIRSCSGLGLRVGEAKDGMDRGPERGSDTQPCSDETCLPTDLHVSEHQGLPPKSLAECEARPNW